jgi:hypothetical protein
LGGVPDGGYYWFLYFSIEKSRGVGLELGEIRDDVLAMFTNAGGSSAVGLQAHGRSVAPHSHPETMERGAVQRCLRADATARAIPSSARGGDACAIQFVGYPIAAHTDKDR